MVRELLIILVAVLMVAGANAQSVEQPGTPPTDSNPAASDPTPVVEPPAENPPPALEPPAEDPSPILKPEPLPIIIGEPGYGGTGCTAGNALVDHDDQGLITVLLAPMEVRGDSSTASFARSACSIRIPVVVPAHKKLAIVEVLNEGLYSVQEGDTLSLTQESGFVGVSTTPQILNLQQNEDTILKWDSSVGQLAESSCERTESVLLLNTNALLKKKSSLTSSHISLDAVSVQLTLEDCDGGSLE